MGEIKGACRDLVGRQRERSHQKELSVDGSLILQIIFKIWMGRHKLDLFGCD
jgi:hypothetical protein